MQTYGNSEVQYEWWAGNARCANQSGGHLWRVLRALGFDFKRVERALNSLKT